MSDCGLPGASANDDKQRDRAEQWVKLVRKYKDVDALDSAMLNELRNMTANTIIATPAVWLPFEEQGHSVAGWLWDAISGNMTDYEAELVNKAC